METPEEVFDFRVVPDAEFLAMSPAQRSDYLKRAILAMSHLKLQLQSHLAEDGEA